MIQLRLINVLVFTWALLCLDGRVSATKDGSKLLWTFRPSDMLPCESSVAVAKNDVFVADASGLYRVDGQSGKMIWKKEASNDGYGSFSPSICQNRQNKKTIVVVPTVTDLEAFDASDGTLLWTVPAEPDRPFDGSASFLSDGSVVFATGT